MGAKNSRLLAEQRVTLRKKFNFMYLLNSLITNEIAEQELLFIKPPDMPVNPRILKMAVLGVPNSGGFSKYHFAKKLKLTLKVTINKRQKYFGQ